MLLVSGEFSKYYNFYLDTQSHGNIQNEASIFQNILNNCQNSLLKFYLCCYRKQQQTGISTEEV